MLHGVYFTMCSGGAVLPKLLNICKNRSYKPTLKFLVDTVEAGSLVDREAMVKEGASLFGYRQSCKSSISRYEATHSRKIHTAILASRVMCEYCCAQAAIAVDRFPPEFQSSSAQAAPTTACRQNDRRSIIGCVFVQPQAVYYYPVASSSSSSSSSSR
jgi:hypothetical protein